MSAEAKAETLAVLAELRKILREAIKILKV
jgi:hypothetical protein